MDWPKDSRKDDYYINEEGMYELLFSSQQSMTKTFRKHCCNVMSPHIRQELTNRMVDDLRRDHALSITDRDNQIQFIQYENVGLQGEIRNARQTVIDLIENRRVPRIGKYDNVLCVFEKNHEDETSRGGEHPYYVVRCQKKVLPTHKKWLKICYPNINEKGVSWMECDPCME